MSCYKFIRPAWIKQVLTLRCVKHFQHYSISEFRINIFVHMKLSISIFILVIISITTQKTFAQTDSLPEFGAPLPIPMYLAGNFAELRGGHFHGGIDIKTNQVEGIPVLAAQDGYVSRVKISLGGYGNALYITHPNGYTTAYGHLQRFNDEINQFVMEQQYARKKFTVERFFNATQIPVKKGDTIALSGNSGGSGGPHLHFEIRKTAGSIPQNPLLFGFDIKDNIAPTIKNIGIYPMNDTSFINGQNTPLILPTVKKGETYVISSRTKLKARGVIGFGIETTDKLNGSNNVCGVYNISLFADSQQIYSHQMDEVRFENSRFIQTHVDFYEAKKNKRKVQKSFVTTYNKLRIYKNLKNKGLVYFSKYGHNLNYIIHDVYQNKATLDFKVDFDSNYYTLVHPLDTFTLFTYKQNGQYASDELKVNIPKYSLYENLKFKTASTDTLNMGVSKVHYVQNLYTPLQKKMTVTIKTKDVQQAEGNKFFAVSLNEDLKTISPEGGLYQNGWVSFKTRSMGPYTILEDTIAPTITPVNFSSKSKNIKALNQLILKVEDHMSGVKNYTAYLDGEWHLLAYDYKTNLVWINLDHHLPTPGKHLLEVKIGDSVNNFKTFSFNFIW